MAVYPNPYVLNIIDLQNVITNAGGVDTGAALSNQVAALAGMIDTTNHIVYADALRDFSGTGTLTVESDLNLGTNWVTGSNVGLYSNGGVLSVGGGSGGSALSSGTTVVTAGEGASTFQVSVAGGSVFGVDGGGNVTASGAMYATGFYTLSDAGFKGNVRPLGTGSLDRVCTLTPACWEWLSDGASGCGLIAQDVAHVFPELVRGVEGEMRIDVMGLLGHVVAAIKELRSAV